MFVEIALPVKTPLFAFPIPLDCSWNRHHGSWSCAAVLSRFINCLWHVAESSSRGTICEVYSVEPQYLQEEAQPRELCEFKSVCATIGGRFVRMNKENNGRFWLD